MNEELQDRVDDPKVTLRGARLVPEFKRLAVLPRLFGRHCVRVEGAVYGMLGRLCARYHGGYWAFYELPNGGFYMAPDSDATFDLYGEGNGFEGTVGADAAGIIACLMAFSHLSFLIDDPRVALAYTRLHSSLAGHPEVRAILKAID